ncbi:MAG: Hsp20/alpha crystallin family protein [Methanomicrobiales archaeon]|nr:Hsp20/alpha crystallin family protein [Methanomicrobiales archaeon]
MAWRRTPYGLRAEFDELFADMQRQFAETMERISGSVQQVPRLGAAETTIDIREHDTDVIIVADLPGVERQDISARLLDPRTLRISARREEAREAEEAGYHMRERRVGMISRTIPLPADVTDKEAQATFKNGVLEVRLKKTEEAGGRVIPVGEEAGRLLRESKEEQYLKEQEEMEPSGYLSPEEVMREAEAIELEPRGSPEEQATAEKLRQQKEELYEEGKKKLSEE